MLPEGCMMLQAWVVSPSMGSNSLYVLASLPCTVLSALHFHPTACSRTGMSRPRVTSALQETEVSLCRTRTLI